MKITVMSYNVRVGIESSLTDIAEGILSVSSPDLVAFQEIGVHWNMGEKVHQPQFIADRIGLPHVSFAGALTDPEGGQFGVALASRYPIGQESVTLHHQITDEQRVFLQARINAPTPFEVLTSHLSVEPEERLHQARALSQRASTIRGPKLVIGDFNARPESLEYAELTSNLTDCFARSGDGPAETFSVKEPHRQIDYILCGGGFIPGPRSWVARSVTASDHFPLLAEIHIP